MAEPLRVGLNLLYVAENSGGVRRYATELVRSLLVVEPDIRITGFVSTEAPADLLAIEGVEWVRHGVTVTHGPPWNAARNVATQWLLQPWLARRRRLDVVHGVANIAPLAAPGVARVVTLLDLIWLRHPEALNRRDTLAMKATALPSARRADRVIAISHAAKDDIVATLGLDPARIDVTQLGVRLDELPEPQPVALGSAGPIVLCVAQKRSHKNLEALTRAVALVDDAVLVIPGSPTPYEDRLRAVASELGMAGRLRLPGWVSDGELEGLYAAATVFALPSFEEGFGLPLLEAMRRDVPVACSDASSLPEVAGGAAELFDPHDQRDIARAIARLIDEPERRQELIERGRARCRELTWERTARATLESYRRAIEA